ncbi:hypothetical protein L1987_49514 [Smallanthus sonchifolius]|uniref:Uncharacterized protein n=1 Tax=Smallanthus sonchifolius TaxID=185202 RepID=A0ACB9FUY3_9ASTR|nr:hypothetical protein L1987_49514 [Smallanthus sonchifolius]
MRHSSGKRKRQDIAFGDEACQSSAQRAKRSSMLITAARSVALAHTATDMMCSTSSVGCNSSSLSHVHTSSSYESLGMCDQICEFCGAMFWFGERLAGFPLSRRPRYSICCRGGKVKLPQSLDMATEPIASIRPGKSGAIIEVRVIRKWMFNSRPDEPWYLFVDRNGDAVQGFAAKINKENVEARLSVMSCYQMDSYTCRATRASMRIVRHDATIKIGKATTIIPVNDDDSIPHYYSEFHPYTALNNRVNDNSVLTDYIGTVESKFDGTTTRNDPFLRVILRNESFEDISVTIWKETLATFDRTALDTINNPIVMAVTSVRVSIFAGRIQLATTPASALYLNPAIPKSAALANRDHISVAPSASSQAHQLTTTPAVETEITLAALAQKQISDFSGLTFVCDASITQYAEGTANVTIFDKIAKQLLQKDASDMVIEEGYDNPETIPPPLLLLRGQPKKFHLRGPQHRRYRNIIFTVSKISDVTIYEKEDLPKSQAETPKSSDLNQQTQEISANSSPLSESTDSGYKLSQKHLHTPSTSTPEIPTPDPSEKTTKRTLLETTAQGISDTKRLRYPDTPTP